MPKFEPNTLKLERTYNIAAFKKRHFLGVFFDIPFVSASK